MKKKNSFWIIVIIILLIILIIILYSRANAKREAALAEQAQSEELGAGPASLDAAAAEISAGDGWLELPQTAFHGGEVPSTFYNVTHWAVVDGRNHRNYTVFYDPEIYASYWVAYPICKMHLGTGREEGWAFDPAIPTDKQTSVKKGYGVSGLATENYASNYYARGHQCPNADRNGIPEMMLQTYYSSNMTPQLQNGLNGNTWAQLEAAVREQVPDNDTLYVVTGANYDGQRGSRASVDGEILGEEITNRDGKVLPVPSAYYKILLKVHRDAEGHITEACSIGFWLPHTDLLHYEYDDPAFIKSVDWIEGQTGFNFFVNVPDRLENQCEANTSWDAFKAF